MAPVLVARENALYADSLPVPPPEPPVALGSPPQRRQRPPRLGASRARQTGLDSPSLAVTTAISFTFLTLAFSPGKERGGLPTSLEGDSRSEG